MREKNGMSEFELTAADDDAAASLVYVKRKLEICANKPFVRLLKKKCF